MHLQYSFNWSLLEDRFINLIGFFFVMHNYSSFFHYPYFASNSVTSNRLYQFIPFFYANCFYELPNKPKKQARIKIMLPIFISASKHLRKRKWSSTTSFLSSLALFSFRETLASFFSLNQRNLKSLSLSIIVSKCTRGLDWLQPVRQFFFSFQICSISALVHAIYLSK